MITPYQKVPISFEEQCNLLISRNLIIQDKLSANRSLSSISYYRLSAYGIPFRQRDLSGNLTEQFKPGTTFDDILRLYEFDRQLRLLVIDAIERIEVAIRTQITHHMAHQYGVFAHTNPDHFHSKFNHTDWLKKLENETNRSSDQFIKHYQKKYTGFPTVPIWMLTEIMSLGALSVFYNGLKNDQRAGIEDKKTIANHFNIHHKRLADWLHTLTYVRNICAHHSRLWNRELSIRPDKINDAQWSPPITPRNDRIFYILLILRYLLRATKKDIDWSKSINELIDPIAKNPAHRRSMGMPDSWETHPIWK